MVALGRTLPAFARMAGGPKAHVCHCETGGAHAHCACPVCFPDLDTLDLRIASISGKCGDDDTGWRALSEPGVLPASLVTVAPFVHVITPEVRMRELASRWSEPPEPPPPRPFSA